MFAREGSMELAALIVMLLLVGSMIPGDSRIMYYR